MSRLPVACLLLTTAVSAGAQPYGPQPPARPAATPVQTLDRQYDERYGRPPPARPCLQSIANDIVVCGAAAGGASPYRVPLRDERFAAGERVRHVSEPASGVFATSFCHRVGCTEPSKFMETVGRIATAIGGDPPR